MKNVATMTSKGQITVPLAVRERLGLVEGDRIEFLTEGGHTIIKPARGAANPFAQFAGALGTFPEGTEQINAWVNDMRKDADEDRC